MLVQYASRGVKLVLIARRAAELEAVANQCWALGANDVLAISADMSKQEDIETVIGSALKSFGR